MTVFDFTSSLASNLYKTRTIA